MNQSPDIQQFAHGLGTAADGFLGGAVFRGQGGGAAAIMPQRVRPSISEPLLRTDDLYWPPNQGVVGIPQKTTLPRGYVLDRKGSERGEFLAPAGTPIEKRSLDPVGRSAPLHRYKVVSPVDVDWGMARPYFGQPGGGLQFKIPGAVENLIPDYLARLD